MKAPVMKRMTRRVCRLAGVATMLGSGWTVSAQGQTAPSPSQGVLGVWTGNSAAGKSAAPAPTPAEPLPGVASNGAAPITDPKVEQAGCATCGRGLLGGPGDFYVGPSSNDACAGGCVPGRRRCDDCCFNQDT